MRELAHRGGFAGANRPAGELINLKRPLILLSSPGLPASLKLRRALELVAAPKPLV
jgi:hypothetical protein